jgi:hypothetical protein
MAVNPFQTVAEMSWGDYKTKKSGSVTSRTPQVSINLSGQGHRSTGSTQAAPVGSLYEPRAGGSMPQGNADIKRPNYGQQQSQQPQRQSRRASFGGMGAGATKGGGGGITVGGDLKIDTSIGKTDMRGANMQGARYGALGMGAKTSDSNLGDIDQSQGYSPSTTAKAGSSRGGAGADGKGGAGGAKAGAGSGAAGAGAAGRGGAGGNAARGGDTGSMNTNMSGQKMGSPTLNIGRNRIDSDNVSRRTKSTKTDVRASGSATASADSKDARKVAPAKPKKEKPAEPTNASTPKEEPKAEAIGKETVKEKAKKAVAKSTTKVATKATKSAATGKKVRAVKTAAKEEEEE